MSIQARKSVICFLMVDLGLNRRWWSLYGGCWRYQSVTATQSRSQSFTTRATSSKWEGKKEDGPKWRWFESYLPEKTKNQSPENSRLRRKMQIRRRGLLLRCRSLDSGTTAPRVLPSSLTCCSPSLLYRRTAGATEGNVAVDLRSSLSRLSSPSLGLLDRQSRWYRRPQSCWQLGRWWLTTPITSVNNTPQERKNIWTRCMEIRRGLPAGKRTEKQSPELPVFAGVLSLSLVPSDKVCCPLSLVWKTRMGTELEKEEWQRLPVVCEASPTVAPSQEHAQPSRVPSVSLAMLPPEHRWKTMKNGEAFLTVGW